MTLAFAGTIVITRHKREISMAPAICLSQLLVFLVFAPVADAASITERDLGLLVLLGVGQMGLGLAFLTVGARLIPAAEAALITLLEVVLGPLWVWLAYGEEPGAATLFGGAVVVGAVILQTTQRAPTVDLGRAAGYGRRHRLADLHDVRSLVPHAPEGDAVAPVRRSARPQRRAELRGDGDRRCRPGAGHHDGVRVRRRDGEPAARSQGDQRPRRGLHVPGQGRAGRLRSGHAGQRVAARPRGRAAVAQAGQ
jgi:EamA-like transporter family